MREIALFARSTRLLIVASGLLIVILASACAGQPAPPLTTTAVPSPSVEVERLTADGSGPMVELTRADLRDRQSITDAEITFIGSTAQEWPDSSLGCPQPGFEYLQVITPGFIVRYEVNGTPYVYHTDTRSTFVLCNPKTP